jgi:hypothetical protein
MVPARPGFIGKLGWARSRAWTWDFSATDSTTAFGGGPRFSSTTSVSFSSQCLSFESLKVPTWWGFMPLEDQISCTVDLETPACLAMERTDHCVASGGVVCKVSCTIWATFS